MGKINNYYLTSKVNHSKKKFIAASIFAAVIIILIVFFIYDSSRIGNELDSYKGVAVYYNGIIYSNSHGKHYSESDYYYGYKWQCVEHIKRFYYQVKDHEMPDLYGNAKDYFDSSVKHGELNKSRGLIQYKNNQDIPPKPDDLLVFTDTKYGHVAIVTEVTETYIEVIQQNVLGKTREKFLLNFEDGKYIVGDKKKPAGWLRLE